MPQTPPETVQQYCLRVYGKDITCCPACGTGKLLLAGALELQRASHEARAPP